MTSLHYTYVTEEEEQIHNAREIVEDTNEAMRLREAVRVIGEFAANADEPISLVVEPEVGGVRAFLQGVFDEYHEAEGGSWAEAIIALAGAIEGDDKCSQ